MLKISLILSIFLVPLVYSQILTLPDEDGFASRFVVKIHQVNVQTNPFRCSGVLINARNTLTTASPIHAQTTTPANLRLHFGSTRLIGSDSALADQLSIHPNFNASSPRENNLAVVRISIADSARTSTVFFMHRSLGRIIENHFCSMMGES